MNPQATTLSTSESAPLIVSTFKTRLMPYFGTPLNAVLSVVFILAFIKILPGLFNWLIFDAAFFPAEPQTCANAAGACWSFVIAKSGQLFLGIYPFDERWRPTLACALIIGLLAWSVRPSSWNKRMALIWAVALLIVLWLMGGGLGLTSVPTSLWGGLPVTLLLTVIAIGIGFPLSMLFALGRRSELPVVRTMCVIFIETVRGLPLLSILFFASIMLPLFLPEKFLPDKFVRAAVALTLFATAYLAEVIRGGLQAVPQGQIEAAKAVGLGYWRMQRLVVMPQAIRVVIPALANTIIVMIKNTSLVLVVGIFDLISSGKAALADPLWTSPSAETYIVISAIFFAMSFAFARFADFLESRAQVSR
jgi:general L-amino acid transport system permease protein